MAKAIPVYTAVIAAAAIPALVSIKNIPTAQTARKRDNIRGQLTYSLSVPL